MIPQDYITEWRSVAPWVDNTQVEQDLVISRALVEIYSDDLLFKSLAFRGGTALYKLHFKQLRYSEDIDLVQIEAGPAGIVMDALQDILNPWLGEPRRKQNQGNVTLIYRFDSEDIPPRPLRLKLEINTREHFAIDGFQRVPYSVKSRWYTGSCSITSYSLNELLATKLRALYQRRKGRDLFDLSIALMSKETNPAKVIKIFSEYMAREGNSVSKKEFAENLLAKLEDRNFISDMNPLLATEASWDIHQAGDLVMNALVTQLK